jgi:hypothetical protein
VAVHDLGAEDRLVSLGSVVVLAVSSAAAPGETGLTHRKN